MEQAIEASGAEIIPEALRRMDPSKPEHSYVYEYIKRRNLTIMPTTAACYSAKEAILCAQLAGEALDTNLVKLEVIGDEKTLCPDNEGLLEAAKVLIDDGFIVM